MTQDAASGYAKLGGDRLWFREDIETYGGGDPQAWADPNGTRWWPSFSGNLTKYADTDVIWWQLCNSFRTSGENVPYETMLAILDEIQARAPGRKVFVSAAPAREGYQCYLETVAGQSLLKSYEDRLVAEGRAMRGPALTPLKKDETSDGCHANEIGEQVWGRDVLAFFGYLSG